MTPATALLSARFAKPAGAEWGKLARELTNGRGVDRVIEVGGPATVNQSLGAVAWGVGEVDLIGFLSADNPGIDYFHLKGSGASVRSIGVGDRSALEDLVTVIGASRIRPVISDVFGFAEARQAFAHLHDGRHFGKVVVRVAS